SPNFTLTTGTPFSVFLDLRTLAIGSFSFEAGLAGVKTFDLFSLADFSHTVSFATGGPVFNLPDGYTVNSASAAIVNNRYLVPEPASVGLVATIAILMGIVRRRILLHFNEGRTCSVTFRVVFRAGMQACERVT